MIRLLLSLHPRCPSKYIDGCRDNNVKLCPSSASHLYTTKPYTHDRHTQMHFWTFCDLSFLIYYFVSFPTSPLRAQTLYACIKLIKMFNKKLPEHSTLTQLFDNGLFCICWTRSFLWISIIQAYVSITNPKIIWIDWRLASTSQHLQPKKHTEHWS